MDLYNAAVKPSSSCARQEVSRFLPAVIGREREVEFSDVLSGCGWEIVEPG